MTRTILITGSYRGLGKATGLELCKLGHTVIFTSRDIAKLQPLQNFVKEKKYSADFLELDVENINSIQSAKTLIEKKYKKIDSLINNAGILIDRENSLSSLPQDLYDQTLKTNLLAPIQVTQEFISLLKKSENGIIVNISSTLGQLSTMMTGMPSYRISKCALNAFTKIMSEELKNDNIKVNSVHPGWVKTDMGGNQATMTIEQSVPGIVWAATLEKDGPTGKFFFNKKEISW
jgi:NAD(P)-dependent dehydrogenase (short-subunit alcohol dehydrogenase family)